MYYTNHIFLNNYIICSSLTILSASPHNYIPYHVYFFIIVIDIYPEIPPATNATMMKKLAAHEKYFARAKEFFSKTARARAPKRNQKFSFILRSLYQLLN